MLLRGILRAFPGGSTLHSSPHVIEHVFEQSRTHRALARGITGSLMAAAETRHRWCCLSAVILAWKRGALDARAFGCRVSDAYLWSDHKRTGRSWLFWSIYIQRKYEAVCPTCQCWLMLVHCPVGNVPPHSSGVRTSPAGGSFDKNKHTIIRLEGIPCAPLYGYAIISQRAPMRSSIESVRIAWVPK